MGGEQALVRLVDQVADDLEEWVDAWVASKPL